jgi:class 3 adenylate cyclase/tetratricopeptide (TPR) repeat protein
VTCPACGAVAPERARFCPECGQPLHARADERRIVTVLFADLVGFTSLSETRDPEQVKNLVDRCFERLVADVTAFGGRVDKIIGDAVVALFGAPVAHEDDAERAVRAALQMQQTLMTFAGEIDVDMQLRIGVNTGEVLVGALRAGGDYTAMGDVVNVAQRLQTLAHPGQVVVGEATYAATRQVVEYHPMGSVQAKGRDEPVQAWAAEAALAPPGRRPRRMRTPLVGREHELELLRHALATAANRLRPQLVLLLGEAGIGKSRLAEEAAGIAGAEHGAVVLEGRCIPYGEANVWWPVAEALRQACGIEPLDSPDESKAKLQQAVATTIGVEPGSTEGTRLVDGLLYLLGDESPLQNVDPARAREEARRAVHALIEGMARGRLLVIVLSELHWADTLVLDLVNDLFQRSRGLPVVLVATARPELQDRWAPQSGRHNVLLLHVDPLDDRSAERLLVALLGDQPPADLRAVLLDRSGGNPFFLEEMVALLVEAGVLTQEGGRYRLGDTAAAQDLPATLRGLVSARLDALAPAEREALEDAAVIGHGGTVAALDALAASRGGASGATVDDLIRKDLLQVDDDDEWAFRSDLVREVAYETLTKAERARRHAALAQWLAAHDDDDLQQLAHHYGTAAILAKELGAIAGVPADICHTALMTIEKAAHWSKQQDFPYVTVRLLDQAEQLLDDDDVVNRRRLLLARAQAHAALRQLPEARADLDAVHVDESETDRHTDSYARYLSVRGDLEQKEGDHEAALATLEEAVALWRRMEDPYETAEALRCLGFTRLVSGDLVGAEHPIAEALAMFKSVGDRRGEAWALQNLAWISFGQGDLATAEERLEASIRMFTEIGDFGGRGWAVGLLGFVRYFEGNLEEAGRLAEEILPESRDTADRWALGMTLVLLANVRLFTGQPVEAMSLAREAAEEFRSFGDGSGEHMALAPLVRALLATGAVREGLAMLEQGVPEGVARYGGPETFAGLLPATAAIQVGDPERAARALPGYDDDIDTAQIGRVEEVVVSGLICLQSGRAADALSRLERAVSAVASDGERANATSIHALCLCAAGRPGDALDAAAALPEPPAGTYLDRAVAATAEGFAFMQLGQRPEGERAFAKALSLVDGTGDRLSQAILRLAYGHALQAQGDDGGTEVLADAHHRLEGMGTDAAGWDTAFRLAARATSTRAAR